MILEVKNLSCGYEGHKIVTGVSFQLGPKDIFCLLGPNGVGKTTLFKTILGFIKPLEGEMRLDGENILDWPRKKFARAIAYIPQTHTPAFPFTVRDVVIMGRTAQLGGFSSPGRKDREIADESLETLDIYSLKDRIYTQLSGGERQMVLIARSLAQQAGILIMDEPTANLDYGNQMKVLNQIRSLAEKGLAIIMTSHDPNHAFLCSSKVLLMQKGNIIDCGTAQDVIKAERLRALYGITVKIIDTVSDENQPTRVCVPFLGGTAKTAQAINQS